MRFTSTVLSAALVGGASAFSRTAFVPNGVVVPTAFQQSAVPSSASTTTSHSAGCECGCRRITPLFMSEAPTVEAEVPAEVPAEVEAMDGVQSDDEAHNLERPARKSLKKKSPTGKPLSEFAEGETVKAKVKAIASYGAFMDIGAVTDGLLHISQLSKDYVANVDDVLEVGSEYDVRITKIDEKKGQVGLSLMTEAEEKEAQEAASRDRPQRNAGGGGGGGNRRDDSAVIASLLEKGWDREQFVEGTVVSTLDFGAFVRVDVSQLNPEVSGEMDGLVHISALAARRVSSVTDIVDADDKVQVRVKSIADRKVSLTMVSPEDEKARMEASGQGKQNEGAKDWRESLVKIQADLPTFQNLPLVEDKRKS